MTDEIRATTEILAVSVDGREGQERMIERVAADDGRRIQYTLLSDPDHAVIDRYGLLNEGALPEQTIPHPTTYVISRDGVVRWKVTETDYRIRPSNEDILEALRELEG